MNRGARVRPAASPARASRAGGACSARTCCGRCRWRSAAASSSRARCVRWRARPRSSLWVPLALLLAGLPAARAAPARLGRRGALARRRVERDRARRAAGGCSTSRGRSPPALLALGVVVDARRAAHHARHAAAGGRAARAARAADRSRCSTRARRSTPPGTARCCSPRRCCGGPAAGSRWRCRAPCSSRWSRSRGRRRSGRTNAGCASTARCRRPAFSRLDSDQTYGPLYDRRTGATMLEITSDEPQLWRMQRARGLGPPRLGRRRTTGPAARARRRARSPPRSGSSGCATDDRRAPGASSRSTARPRTAAARAGASTRRRSKGVTYTVTSQVVRATAEQLATVKIPAARRPTTTSRGCGRGASTAAATRRCRSGSTTARGATRCSSPSGSRRGPTASSRSCAASRTT